MQRPSRILAVDDNPLNLTVLESLLTDYHLQTAASGSQSLEAACTFRPDVVLLDIMMPGMDGYATCRSMRQNPSLRHLKIIMLSAKSELNERLAGYDSGADDYITKPFDGDELLAKVRVYLKLKSVEEIEEAKNRTIQVLQHSNRTPLNSIISYAELLADHTQLDDDTRSEGMQVILRQARRLHQLLEKGETLASMQSGQFYFAFERHDVCEIIRQVVEELQPKCREPAVSLDQHLPSAAEATCDRTQIEFVVRAMLENAIRFSEPQEAVSVALDQAGSDLTLTVIDRGAGIPSVLLPQVFEPFGNPESPLFNRGDGLSLAIAQQIAWAHHGDLWVESEHGRGAAFSMRVPIAGPTVIAEAGEASCTPCPL